ncbi:MAG: hypothetical protein Q3972_09140 [Corynebacterium sp.]|nr:hypothetical protein [Corynebacterium sp.]
MSRNFGNPYGGKNKHKSFNFNININSNNSATNNQSPQNQEPQQYVAPAPRQEFTFDNPVDIDAYSHTDSNLVPAPYQTNPAKPSHLAPSNVEFKRRADNQRFWPWLAVFFDISLGLGFLGDTNGFNALVSVPMALICLAGALWYIYCRHIDREHMRAWHRDYYSIKESNEFLVNNSMVNSPLSLPPVPEKYRPAATLVIWINILAVVIGSFAL